jgi:hypothetical protein
VPSKVTALRLDLTPSLVIVYELHSGEKYAALRTADDLELDIVQSRQAVQLVRSYKCRELSNTREGKQSLTKRHPDFAAVDELRRDHSVDILRHKRVEINNLQHTAAISAQMFALPPLCNNKQQQTTNKTSSIQGNSQP